VSGLVAAASTPVLVLQRISAEAEAETKIVD